MMPDWKVWEGKMRKLGFVPGSGATNQGHLDCWIREDGTTKYYIVAPAHVAFNDANPTAHYWTLAKSGWVPAKNGNLDPAQLIVPVTFDIYTAAHVSYVLRDLGPSDVV